MWDRQVEQMNLSISQACLSCDVVFHALPLSPAFLLQTNYSKTGPKTKALNLNFIKIQIRILRVASYSQTIQEQSKQEVSNENMFDRFQMKICVKKYQHHTAILISIQNSNTNTEEGSRNLPNIKK